MRHKMKWLQVTIVDPFRFINDIVSIQWCLKGFGIHALACSCRRVRIVGYVCYYLWQIQTILFCCIFRSKRWLLRTFDRNVRAVFRSCFEYLIRKKENWCKMREQFLNFSYVINLINFKLKLQEQIVSEASLMCNWNKWKLFIYKRNKTTSSKMRAYIYVS